MKEQKGIIQSSDRVRRRKKTLDANSFPPLEFDWIKNSQTQVDKIFVLFTYELFIFHYSVYMWFVKRKWRLDKVTQTLPVAVVFDLSALSIV